MTLVNRAFQHSSRVGGHSFHRFTNCFALSVRACLARIAYIATSNFDVKTGSADFLFTGKGQHGKQQGENNWFQDGVQICNNTNCRQILQTQPAQAYF